MNDIQLFATKAERGCWIFGAGTIGRRIMRVLEKFPIFAISGFIDNDTHKVGGYIGNYRILSIKQYQKNFWGMRFLLEPKMYQKKKCAHGCNYVDMRQGDMDIGEVISTTDAFFKKVDYCRDFVFMGENRFFINT